MRTTSYLILLITGLAALLCTACQKYEEGPALSLRSKKERVSNTWQVDNYKLNGTDYTSLVAGYSETYKKNGEYMYNWGSLNGTGSWELVNNGSEIAITGLDNQGSRTLVIVKLKEKEFWYYYLDGSDKHEFHLIEQ